MPIAVVLAVALGVLGYYNERNSREGYFGIGDTDRPDRIDVLFNVQKVEAQSRELVVQLRVEPKGGFAVAGDVNKPTKQVLLDIPLASVSQLKFPANERITPKDLRIPLDEGVVSDFPFDRYLATLAVGVEVDGAPAPITVAYADRDPFFLSTSLAENVQPGAAYAEVQVKRSRSTFILAWFQVIVMWLLALSVLGGAIHIVRRRLGLVWPALGWMAATLFALVGFRNAAPGLPPIGSMIDYCAFFWSEAVITLSLVLVTYKGIRLRS